jgi:hypothetical protein
MSRLEGLTPEIRATLSALCNNDATEGEVERLEASIGEDDESIAIVLDYLQLHSDLYFEFTSRNASAALLQSLNSAPFVDGTRLKSEIGQDTTQPSGWRFLSSVNSGFSSLSAEWPIAYLTATVVVAIGLTIAAVTYISRPDAIASRTALPGDTKPEPFLLGPSPKSTSIGRITGMVECVWEVGARDWGRAAGAHGQDTNLQATVTNHAVSLGDRFCLRSGLLEITYNSGARVLLQGPATYDADSVDGGFLMVGRLTAKLEKKERRTTVNVSALHRSGASVSGSPISLFTITTPTAIVTDLGTEFAVDVNRDGVTRTHVFVGKVKVAKRTSTATKEKPVPSEQVLIAGQSVIVKSDASVESVSWKEAAELPRSMPMVERKKKRIIDTVDYSETWTANSPTRAGSHLLLNDPVSLQVERCYGNPSRSWVFSVPFAMTTWPSDSSPVPWPGCLVEGSKSGFAEAGVGPDCLQSIEYGLRKDFVVQFDAVQTDDRMNISIGEKPATIYGQVLSVFFRASGSKVLEKEMPTLSLHAEALGEIETGLVSGIEKPWQWHNYAVRFNLAKKTLTVWVDYQCRGEIDLTAIPQKPQDDSGSKWGDLPWSNRYVTVGGEKLGNIVRVWTDNFRVGSPAIEKNDSQMPVVEKPFNSVPGGKEGRP